MPMAKKRVAGAAAGIPSPVSGCHPSALVKLAGAAFLVICFILFFRIQIWASRSVAVDSRVSQHFVGNPKIAFLFLARASLPLDFMWHAFFKNGDAANFSIYIHSSPGFVFDKLTTSSPYFYGRQLKDSVQVAWGESSMIKAERLLFGSALQDPANQRFVLLSDSCIPLYNFSYIYNYLFSSPKSFVDSFVEGRTRDERYNSKMSPTIPKEKWRKGSQWIMLIRRHAEIVVSDVKIIEVFQRYCKRRAPFDPVKKKNFLMLLLPKEHNCIPDEHYVQTLFSMLSLDDQLERRTLTYTSWNQSKKNIEEQDWHPFTFDFNDVDPQSIKAIKETTNVYYGTEYRTEWCHCNGTIMPCYLFARKFTKSAAMRLLKGGLVGPVDAVNLLNVTNHSSPT